MSAEPVNVMRGHKANIHNPNTSNEAKQHSKEVLENEFGIVEKSTFEEVSPNTNTSTSTDKGGEAKDPSNVARGLKAALHNPNVSEEAKEAAEERLQGMQ